MRNAGAFLLFLSEGVLLENSVQEEIRWALKYRKQFILVHEADPSKQTFEFSVPEYFPSDINMVDILANTKSIPYRSRGWERGEFNLFNRVAAIFIYSFLPAT